MLGQRRASSSNCRRTPLLLGRYLDTGRPAPGVLMSKLRMDPPLGGGTAPELFVKVLRRARPPTPWSWAIHEEGQSEPFRRSMQNYRCAEDAWAVGRAMLNRLPRLDD
jgi:hypothetical protein